MIIINNNFDIGEIVYLKTDLEQLPRIIIAIMTCADNGILYKLSQGESVTWQYEIELSREQDVALRTAGI